MSVTYGFYNSKDKDRLYDAEDMSKIFDGLITDGVYATVGDRFTVRPGTDDNTVIIGSGRAWFNHTWTYNDADLSIDLGKPNAIYSQWDAIVLDIHNAPEYRLNDIVVVSGTPSSVPEKPTMYHSDIYNQYPLCYIYRYPGISTIRASDITMVVGTDECPYSESMLTDTKNIAPVENNDKATRDYLAGEYILWHDELCKLTVAILEGTTLRLYPEEGYNLKHTTMSEELYTTFVFDGVPRKNSNNPVTSDGIYKALDEHSGITIKEEALYNNPGLITSGAVYSALGNRSYIGDILSNALDKTKGGAINGDLYIQYPSSESWLTVGNPNSTSSKRGVLRLLGSTGSVHTLYASGSTIASTLPSEEGIIASRTYVDSKIPSFYTKSCSLTISDMDGVGTYHQSASLNLSSGERALGIVAIDHNRSTVVVSRFYLNSSGTSVTVYVRHEGSAKTSVTLTVDVLIIKS